MKRCLLFTGGPLDDCDCVSFEGWDAPDSLVIACDAGLRAALHFGITPSLAVGDFDSFSEPPPPGMPIYAAPAQKDDTDTMLGIRTALQRGCDRFLIVGGFGGRLDHTLANLQTLGFLASQQVRGEIRANRNRAWAVRDGALELPRKGLEDWYISVLAWGGVCTGVTLEGLAYPLENAVLTPGIPLGVSNMFSGSRARIAVRQGTLLVVASKEK